MSAAALSEPPYDPHQRLGEVQVPSTPTTARTRMVLHLWGAAERDIQRARDAFAVHPSRNYWVVDETQTTVDIGPRCTITPDDYDAYAQGANYGWAWAIYRA